MTTPSVWTDLPTPLVGDKIPLTGPIQHYLARVLRVQVGDTVELMRKGHYIALAAVDALEAEAVTVTVQSVKELPPSSFELNLVLSPLKGKTSRELVSRLAELGVARLIFLNMTRSVARYDSSKIKALQTVADEGARKVGQPNSPQVLLASSWTEALALTPQDQPLLVFHEHGDQGLSDLPLTDKSGAFCVLGPEGGLADEELVWLGKQNAHFIRLNGPAYRAVTAGIVGVSILLHRAGEI